MSPFQVLGVRGELFFSIFIVFCAELPVSVVVVVLLFDVHDKHLRSLRSCRDGQLT